MLLQELSITQIGLSVRSVNILRRAGIHTVGTLLLQTEASLSLLRNMGKKSLAETLEKIEEYSAMVAANPQPGLPQDPDTTPRSLKSLLKLPQYRASIEGFFRENDVQIANAPLSNRARNQLQRNGYHKLSDILFLSESQLLSLPAMGQGSVSQILDYERSMLQQQEQKLLAYCSGYVSVLWQDEAIRNKILAQFEVRPFIRFSYEKPPG